jgi:hypothetical protein
MSWNWSDMPQDIVWRLVSRKFLCVVFFFWLVIVNHTQLCVPVLGCVGPVGMEWKDLLLIAAIIALFIYMEGRADEVERSQG